MNAPTPETRSFRSRVWVLASFGVGLLLIAAAFLKVAGQNTALGLGSHTRSSPTTNSVTDAAACGIIAEPAIVDFGECEQGQNAVAMVRIINRTDKPLVVGRTTTSCPCLTLEPKLRRLEPGEQVVAELRLDLAHESQFTGGLLMKLDLFDDEGKQALALDAKMIVKKRF